FIGLLSIGFSKVREEIEKTDKEMDALAESAAKPIGDMLKAQGEAAAEAADGYRRFTNSLRTTKSAEDDVAGKIQERLNLYNQEIELIKKLTAAREAAALKQIGLDEATGKITAAQAALQRGAIEGKQQREATKFDHDSMVHQIDEFTKGIAEAQKEQGGIPNRQAALSHERGGGFGQA
ncbi:MAG TPA: hypothetical protein VGO67_09745, partial [Verrucomicrobiae bacterium]